MQYEYDWWGRVVRQVDAMGAEIRMAYDNSGRRIAKTDALGNTTTWTFDGLGKLTSLSTGDGATTTWGYGGLGWMNLVRHPDGTELRGWYNREGWLMRLENERGESHVFEHDADGLVSWEKNFHQQETRFGYDLLGRLTWMDDGAGKYQRTLSAAGLLLAEEAPDGSRRTFEYNPKGELLRAFAGDEGVEWALDPMGRVVKETLHVDGQKYVVDSQRTVGGDRTAFQTSAGLEMAVQRDAMGRVRELWTQEERVLGIERNIVEQPVRRDLGQGGAILDGYDAIGRVVSRQVVGPGSAADAGHPAWVGGPRPGTIGRTYDYTPVHEVREVLSADGSGVAYEYDSRRHLRAARSGMRSEVFASDATGNHHEVGAGAPARTYGPGNQLTVLGDQQYLYDQRGYLIEKRRTVGEAAPEVTHYAWSPWGMLQRVDLPDGRAVEMKYDPFARRVAKRVTDAAGRSEEHHYVWDRLTMVHDLALGSGSDPAAVRTYLFEDHDDPVPIGHREERGWVHYLNDVNGIPEEIVDGSGRSLGKLARTPWGRTRQAAGTITTPFRHPGQVEDAETGLHYNRYRHYDPDAGRFISPDPLGIDGNLNLYEFAPNPIGWADPMGWQHTMNFNSNDNGFPPAGNHVGGGVPNAYQSGYAAGGPPCPPWLANQANAHTEQKFAHDLMARNAQVGPSNGQNLTGNTYNLSGVLPPCPTCHVALRTAAAQTGATVNYAWGPPNPGSITYNGAAPPTFALSGTALQPTYGAPMVPNTDRRWEPPARQGRRPLTTRCAALREPHRRGPRPSRGSTTLIACATPTNESRRRWPRPRRRRPRRAPRRRRKRPPGRP